MKIATLTMVLLAAMAASAADIHKAANKDALNLASSWVEGIVPGPSDTIFWHPLTATDELPLGGNMSIFGADFGIYGGASLTVNATQDATLEIGAGGIEMSNTGKSVTLNPAIRLTADQQWANRAGTFNFNNPAASIDLNGHELTLLGINETKASFTGNGALRIQGSPKFSSGASAPNADVTLINGATFHFNQSASENKNVRAKSVTVDARGGTVGTIYAQGNAKINGTDVIENAVSLAYGVTDINVAAAAGYSHVLEIGSLAMTERSFARFRGNSLGMYSLDSLTGSGASAIKCLTPPALVGGIIPGAVVANNSASYNVDATTLATYDESKGIRGLDLESEYDSAIVSGSSENGNVRLISEGTGRNPVVLQPGVTSVNSLFLDTGTLVAGQGGAVLKGSDEGESTLKVRSGFIYARHQMESMTDKSDIDIHEISGLTIDMEGKPLKILDRQRKTDNLSAVKSLVLDWSLSNDNGAGVTYGGEGNGGHIVLAGTKASTYTGPTRIAGCMLRVSKTAINGQIPYGIPGDVEVYGGGFQATGRQLSPTSTITIYGGTFRTRGGNWNSGSGADAYFHNIRMYAGTTEFNTSDKGNFSEIDSLHLTGGKANVTRQHRVVIKEALTLDGGCLQTARSKSYNANWTRTIVNCPLEIRNTDKGAYTPLLLDAGAYDTTALAYIPGADMFLHGDVTFYGNETNTNAVRIHSDPVEIANVGPALPGVLRLSGARAFEIGNGAADVDLRITALVGNGYVEDNPAKAVLEGGLVKKGAGTLMLANGGTYTGGTTVEAGRLIVDGSLAGGVSVASGAVFRGGDAEESGALAVAGDVTLASGAKLEIDPGAVMTVDGTLTLDGVEAVLKPGAIVAGEAVVARATSIVGRPVGDFGKYKVAVRNFGTELRICLDNGLTIIFR